MTNIVAKIRSLLTCLLFLSLVASSARAQCHACNWSDRGDRFEGVLNKPSAAGSCRFLGLQYKRTGRIAEGAKSLYLHFWLPAPEKPAIEVWEEAKNYWMVPKSRQYPQGHQSFSWSRQEVIKPLGINVEDLHVSISDPGKTLYFPVSLSSEEKPSPETGYVFAFDCSAGIEVDVTILREEGGKLVTVCSFPYTKDYAGHAKIEWKGLDGKGNPAPPGVYVFRLKGDLLADTIKKLNRNISFHHHGQIE